MSDFFVEFRVLDEDRYARLNRVVEALRAAKRDGDFRDDAYWLSFFDDSARRTFWWPTAEERDAWAARWLATPVETRHSDPTLLTPWDFGSMIDAFSDGDYDILGLRRLSGSMARFEYEPHGWPYGGTGCMRALIEAFAHQVTRIGDV